MAVFGHSAVAAGDNLMMQGPRPSIVVRPPRSPRGSRIGTSLFNTCAPSNNVNVSGDADAIFVATEGNETEPVNFHGKTYEYFLETFIARDFMEDFNASVEGVSATQGERCERLIRYAQDDA